MRHLLSENICQHILYQHIYELYFTMFYSFSDKIMLNINVICSWVVYWVVNKSNVPLIWMIMIVIWKKLSFPRRVLSYTAFFVAFKKIMYSASIKKVAIVSYFFDDQATELLVISNKNPLIECWLLESWAQLESVHPTRSNAFLLCYSSTKQ